MRRAPRIVMVGVMCGLTALACGSGPGDSLVRGSRKVAAPTGPSLGVDLQQAFLVPPDRARIGVRIEVAAADYAAAADALREAYREIEVALSDVPGCDARLLDYQRPGPAGKRHVGAVELVVDVELAGLATVPERMDRLDACATVLDARAGVVEPEGDEPRITVGPGIPHLVVDDPQRHHDALVQREVARHAAAAAVGGAPQLHPEDLRCVPTGRVDVKRRTLAGVELETTVNCRIVGPGTPDGA